MAVMGEVVMWVMAGFLPTLTDGIAPVRNLPCSCSSFLARA